jgi:hypothetical protein
MPVIPNPLNYQCGINKCSSLHELFIVVTHYDILVDNAELKQSGK